MDDLFVEVHRRQNKKLLEVDYPRLGRRGSGTPVGIKQLFAGLKNTDARSSVTPPKNAALHVNSSTPRSVDFLISSHSQVNPTQPLDLIGRPYASSTDIRRCAPSLESVPVTSARGRQKVIQSDAMKKVPTDPRIVGKHKAPASNTQWYVPTEYLGLPSAGGGGAASGGGGGGVLHHAVTTDAPLSSTDHDTTFSDMSDGGGIANTGVANESSAGAVSGDATIEGTQGDDTDGQLFIDAEKTKEAIEHYKKKIDRIMRDIKAEQQVKQENVNEYLQLASAAGADKMQMARIKTVFEKKNQKSTHLIAVLQRKLDLCVKRLKEVETSGVCSTSKQGNRMLKDVGHGIKTIVSKPKEFAHLLRNKFGSADNISGVEAIENGEHSEENQPFSTRRGSVTLPTHFKFHSTDNVVNLDQQDSSAFFHGSDDSTNQRVAPVNSSLANEDLEIALHQLQRSKSAQDYLHECITDLMGRIEENHGQFKQALEEEKVRREHLEEQVNDLMELHQNEVINLKQELSSIEEKMEYQLEERTRDMQELLESCQTKITKMDLQQQQQQQLISMESFDNSTVRSLITKLINVILALLAVILVLINTATNLLEPFVNTRAAALMLSPALDFGPEVRDDDQSSRTMLRQGLGTMIGRPFHRSFPHRSQGKARLRPFNNTRVRCVATIIGVVAIAILWHNSDLISSASGSTNNWFKSLVKL